MEAMWRGARNYLIVLLKKRKQVAQEARRCRGKAWSQSQKLLPIEQT
jgi:hypothetical protein